MLKDAAMIPLPNPVRCVASAMIISAKKSNAPPPPFAWIKFHNTIYSRNAEKQTLSSNTEVAALFEPHNMIKYKFVARPR